MRVATSFTLPEAPRRRMALAVKFAAALIGLVTLVLVINGLINVWLSYEEAKRASVRVQREKAQAAAERIDLFVSGIEQQLGWTTRAEWARIPVEQRRYDFIRLLRQAPAITELIHVDGAGKEQLRLSRLEPDVVGGGADYAADPRFTKAIENKIWFGPVTFRRGSEPYTTIALSHGGRMPGVTIAEVNLKLIWDVVTSIKIGEAGLAFITDTNGRLVAHPDMSLVLRETDLSKLPHIARAIASNSTAANPIDVTTSAGLDGKIVLAASAPIARLKWFVFVQVPAAEALAPVYASLAQTAALLGLGLLLASVMGGLLARRMVVPIQRLQEGAERLGKGQLDQRIDIKTGDEIETLAGSFNQMAARIQESYATLEAKVEARTHDLNEALEFQTATSEVLSVIGRSPNDAKPVFEAVCRSATRLCNAAFGGVFIYDGELLHVVSRSAGQAATKRLDAMYPMPPDRTQIAGRAVLDARTIQVPDLLVDKEYLPGLATLAGWRSMMSVPMMRRGLAIGAISVAKVEPGAFSERQSALLSSFADQAVIAIENARLFEAEQTRTKELGKSLDELRTTQDRLVQTEKLASLGQLTAGIAHEIKNPLNFVNNFAALSGELLGELDDILKPAPLNDNTRAEINELTSMLKGNLEKVVQHGKRADSIVKNMLLHSREGSGEHRLVDVNALVEESVNLAYHGARAEKPGFNITLEKKLDPAAGQVDLFPQEITRVLLNLVTNGFYAATKRSKENGAVPYEPTLSAATRNLGDRVEIRVRDNGSGIPPEVKTRMFNPFFTTKPAGEGTGLGLSLSHDIVVKQHGGTIEVETQPGAFTEFIVTLPRILAKQIVSGNSP